MASRKKTIDVNFRPFAKDPMDRFNHEQYAGATPEEAVTESFLNKGMEHGAASDQLSNYRLRIVDDHGEQFRMPEQRNNFKKYMSDRGYEHAHYKFFRGGRTVKGE